MIEIRNINKHYGEKIALDNVSMIIPDNCIVGLVGKNGAGYSKFRPYTKKHSFFTSFHSDTRPILRQKP
jgi:ABC-type enterochelin transport system ATPase subunit